jgi:hypothetical protein
MALALFTLAALPTGLGLAICYTPLHGVALGLPRMTLSIGYGWWGLFGYAD